MNVWVHGGDGFVVVPCRAAGRSRVAECGTSGGGGGRRGGAGRRAQPGGGS